MKVLYKIFVLLLAGPLVFIFARTIRNVKWFRYLFIGLHALFLTYCTVFLLNRPEWRWAEQKSILKNIGGSENTKAYEFVANNFLLVDNSFDKTLVPHPDGDESDSSALVITNRKSLAKFLEMLNANNSQVDLVVVDMGFELATGDDSLLKGSLQNLYASDKLLLSVNALNKDHVKMIENPAVYGNISERSKDNLFTSHQIAREGYYSLPYKIYTRLNGKKPGRLLLKKELFREKNDRGRSSFALNTFFPRFYFVNEKALRGQVDPSQSPAESESGTERTSRHYYFLSQPLSPDGNAEFKRNLLQRKQSGKRNIIFIGAFASSDEDVHHTLYGELHGTTIILNVLYNLQKRNHILNFGYVLFLFMGYAIISFFLFYHGLAIPIHYPKKLKTLFSRPAQKSKTNNTKTKKKEIAGDGLISWFGNLIKFILYFLFVKELPITLLLLFSIIVQLFFGQWPNILPLVIYLTGIIVSLDYAKKKILKIEDVH